MDSKIYGHQQTQSPSLYKDIRVYSQYQKASLKKKMFERILKGS